MHISKVVEENMKKLLDYVMEHGIAIIDNPVILKGKF